MITNTSATSGGDLKYLTDNISEADRYYRITPSFNSTGNKISFVIPENKKFIFIRATVIPEQVVSNNSYCYADIKFGDQVIDTIFYDYRLTNSTKQIESIDSHYIHGDGERKLEINITHISESSHAILIGFFEDTISHLPNKIEDVSAVEISPDDIKLTWIAPLDNGGKPIQNYRIQRTSTVTNNVPTGFTNSNDTYSPTETSEDNLTFDDTTLADNTTYYYKIFPRTSEGLANDAIIVSATTEIDHPGIPLNISAESISSSSIRISWEANEDSGGVSVSGYLIERSTSESSGYTVLVADTGNENTSYLDTELVPPQTYYYRLKTINSSNKLSLAYSTPVNAEAKYLPPTNARNTVYSNPKSVLIEWDSSLDINSQTVTGYKIERSTNDILFIVLVANTNSQRTNYTDSAVSGNKVYYYKVSVIANSVTSPASNSTRASIPFSVPSAPRNLAASSLSNDKVFLTWEHPTENGGLPISSYVIQRSESIGFPNGSSGNQFEQTNTPALAIMGQAVITNDISINTANAVTVGAVSVEVSITHSWRGDIEVVLVAPNGVSFILKNIDFSDSADDVIETYSGNIFNKLIGINSKGAWTLKVRDGYSAADHGTLDSWKLTIDPALESLNETTVASDLEEYTVTGLSAVTQYFFRMYAITSVGNGDFSSTANATTQKSIFGNGADGSLTIAANATVNLTGNKQYSSITIETGGTLNINAAIVRCTGTYTQNGTGKIIATQTGCPGGMGGVTGGGIGGRDRYSGTVVTLPDSIPASSRPAVSAIAPVLTPPTTAVSCTDDVVASSLLSNIQILEQFDTKFINDVNGGMGSDGTAAATSGTGGAVGNRYIFNGSAPGYLLGGGGNGGNGGTAAQGVDGVIGGGKFAFIVNTIASTITIEAKGSVGNNGKQGTGQAGTSGTYGVHVRSGNSSGNGANGTAASSTGTNGSKGSQGGIVYLVYQSIPNQLEINDLIDVTGGLGGFNGSVAGASTVLTTTRADTGPNGILVSGRASSLLS